MIEYRKGDLLEVTDGVIAHGCNCLGVMGSGVALLIKKKYPHVEEKYRRMVLKESENSRKNFLGAIQMIKVNDSLHVANMFTQVNVKGMYSPYEDNRMVSYDAIKDCFTTISYIDKDVQIHIPKIGAGLAGGDWDIIEFIINKSIGDRKVICWTLD